MVGPARFRADSLLLGAGTGKHEAEISPGGGLMFEFFEEFSLAASTEAEGPFTLNSGTDAQAIDPAVDTTQVQGVWQCVTGNADGTTAADGSQLLWGRPVQLDGAGGNVVLEGRIRILTAVTDVSVNFGLTDSLSLEEPFTIATATITSTATDAACFVYDTAATTDQWFGCAVDTDTDDTGNAATGVVPVAGAWQVLKIEMTNDGASVWFSIDGEVVLSLTGAAGVGPDAVLYPTIIACATTTTSKTVEIDWIRLSGVR